MSCYRFAMLTLCCIFTVTPLDAAPQDSSNSGDSKHSTPAFQVAEATQIFMEGRDLFEKGDWKQAEKRFKECRKLADRQEKKLLKTWFAACKGGARLDKISRAVSKEKWHAAWGELQKIKAVYGETPLENQLHTMEKKIEKQLFLPLATFENPAPDAETSAHGSGEINTDLKYVRAGKRSLRWSEEVSLERNPIAFLPLAMVEGSQFQEYRYLRLSIYSTDDLAGKYTVFFSTGHNPAAEPGGNPMDILRTRCFFHHLNVNKMGWTEFRIDLWKQLSTHSGASRSDIEGLSLLMIPPSRPKTIYIDEVKLEKK